MIGMIVTGHGNFATGLTSSVKLIAGMPELYEMVDFVETDTTDDLKANLNKAVDNLSGCEAIMVFSDLMGGSPFKTAVEVSMMRTENIKVLAGTNLGMLIEISMARQFIEDFDMLCDMAVNTGKDQVIKYTYVERVQEESEDGI
ncbi:MAG: PTS galactosamine/N-acetylgalactosamine transporter subunit IIA [Erysipelotrichaceae bacterium]